MKIKKEIFLNSLTLLSYDDDNGDSDYISSFTVLYFIPPLNRACLTDLISLCQSLPFNVSFPVQIHIN